jgi:hypothetical protein
MKMPACLGQRHIETDGRHHVLKLAAASFVHVHVSAGDERQSERATEALQRFETLTIRSISQQLHGNPQRSRKTFREPAPRLGIGFLIRQPQDQALVENRLDVGTREGVLTLLRRASPARDETAQSAVTLSIRRQRDEAQPAGEPELRASDDLEDVPCSGQLFCFDVRPHDTGDGTFVGDRERRQPKLTGTPGELAWMRSTP